MLIVFPVETLDITLVAAPAAAVYSLLLSIFIETFLILFYFFFCFKFQHSRCVKLSWAPPPPVSLQFHFWSSPCPLISFQKTLIPNSLFLLYFKSRYVFLISLIRFDFSSITVWFPLSSILYEYIFSDLDFSIYIKIVSFIFLNHILVISSQIYLFEWIILIVSEWNKHFTLINALIALAFILCIFDLHKTGISIARNN